MKVCKAKLDSKTIETWIMVFVLIVVLFKAVAALLPEAQSAGDELNASGMPLGSFFVADGVIWIILAAALVFVVYKSFMGKAK